MPQGKPKFKKQQRPATNTKLGKHIAKDRKPKPAKNTEIVKLRKKLTSQLASQIETSMAVKAASAGARLKLLKAPEETTKGKQTQKPKEKR